LLAYHLSFHILNITPDIKMRFSTQTLIALMASPLLALADGNTFTNSNYNGITAGKTFDLTWKPTTSGTVSIILRSGASNNLTPGVYVARKHALILLSAE